MKKNRIIPIIILRNGEIVQSYGFEKYKVIGNAVKAVERFSQWDADEIIYIDITPHSLKSGARQDLNTTKLLNRKDLISEVSKRSTMPLTFGGGLRSTQDIEEMIYCGADKVSLNTTLLEDSRTVKRAVEMLGSQAIVASIDYGVVDDQEVVWNPSSRTYTQRKLIDWVREVEQFGVGEILLTCVSRDGSRQGYDLRAIERVSSSTNLPVIANSGVGDWTHLIEGLEVGADAVAAANIFHFFDQSVYLARKFLYDAGLPVRKPTLASIV